FPSFIPFLYPDSFRRTTTFLKRTAKIRTVLLSANFFFSFSKSFSNFGDMHFHIFLLEERSSILPSAKNCFPFLIPVEEAFSGVLPAFLSHFSLVFLTLISNSGCKDREMKLTAKYF
ncbi:hypothetical protein ACX0G9_28685, partial [Flavitalea flava]